MSESVKLNLRKTAPNFNSRSSPKPVTMVLFLDIVIAFAARCRTKTNKKNGTGRGRDAANRDDGGASRGESGRWSAETCDERVVDVYRGRGRVAFGALRTLRS